MDPALGPRLRALRQAAGLSLAQLAAQTHTVRQHLSDIERGRRRASPQLVDALDRALAAGGALSDASDPAASRDVDAAAELVDRAQSSDVCVETLDLIESEVDDAATSYATTPPTALLPLVRQRLAVCRRLMDARSTLAQQRRLYVAAGWLSLLAATLHVDLRQGEAAGARLATAETLAAQAGHAEITAWCWETRAWDLLTAGDYAGALTLSQRAQAIAPAGSSAHIQATAQEGRAWARLGDRRATARALTRVEQLTTNLRRPDKPEHHYQYDPDKARSYTATTLAWVGDPAAVHVAGEVVAELDQLDRPRRAASARLDLALALATTGHSDAACLTATAAVETGRIVPSNWWRVDEVLRHAEQDGAPGAMELRETCRAYRPTGS